MEKKGSVIPFPSKKYNIIYADPPWQYKVWSKKAQRSVERHYDVMTPDEIKKLPVCDLAGDSCVLFLWITAPCLPQGIETIKSWGFTYKTVAFTWVKKNKKASSLFWGMGYYTRANTEYCLLATKGKTLERKSKAVHQVIIDRVREHSRKPDSARSRIVKLFGDIPRIELFARQMVSGWDSWGSDVEQSINKSLQITA